MWVCCVRADTTMASYAHTIIVSIVCIKTQLDLFTMAGSVIKSRSRRLQTHVRYNIDWGRPAYTKYNIVWGYYMYMDALREYNTHTNTHIHTYTKYINDRVLVYVCVERRRESYQTVLNELQGEIKS